MHGAAPELLQRRGSSQERWALLRTALQDLVVEAERSEPGGVDGGPGNLTAKKAFLAVEAVIGRPLTKEECTRVREELPVLTMQVTPAAQIGSRCLYLGTYYNAINLDELKARGVRHVINLCAEERFKPPRELYDAAGVRCLHMPIFDRPSQPLDGAIESSLDF